MEEALTFLNIEVIKNVENGRTEQTQLPNIQVT